MALTMYRLQIWRRGVLAIILQVSILYLFFTLNYYSGEKKFPVAQTPAQNLAQFRVEKNEDKNSAINKTDIEFLMTRRIELKDDNFEYFISIQKGTKCYIHGTNFSASSDKCVCLKDYFGDDCGIPAAAWYTEFKNDEARQELKRREVPRRLIHGIVVNHEFELIEVRLNELDGIIDVYVIGESNYSTKGDPKPLRLLEKFGMGFMQQYHSNIVYVLQEEYPEEGIRDGWYAEGYVRTHMSVNGIKRLENTRPDDLFLCFDADEIPSREILMFLKLYDGYREPIGFVLRWSIFGFFWMVPFATKNFLVALFSDPKDELPTEIVAAATLGFLETFCNNNVTGVRKLDLRGTPLSKIEAYEEKYNTSLSLWWVGKDPHFAGHHCSWCLVPEDIVIKLETANKEDKPRWGDYPEKLNLNYIRELIKKGLWFDDKTVYTKRLRNSTNYAPKYMLDNPKKFSRFIINPYE